MSNNGNRHTRVETFRTAAGLLAEVLFVIVPILVIYLVSLTYNRGEKVLESPEWSVGSIILFGQVLVKFMLGVSRKKVVAAGPLALAFVLVVMFGILPACFLLIQVTLNESAMCSNRPIAGPLWINAAQIVLFVLAIGMYLGLGLFVDLLMKERVLHTNGRHQGEQRAS